jgi:hypothetical protein
VGGDPEIPVSKEELLRLAAVFLNFIFFSLPFTFAPLLARVAKLVDAADSKSAVRKDVLVRFQSRARLKLCKC